MPNKTYLVSTSFQVLQQYWWTPFGEMYTLNQFSSWLAKLNNSLLEGVPTNFKSFLSISFPVRMSADVEYEIP